jgi:hypothetical protein
MLFALPVFNSQKTRAKFLGGVKNFASPNDFAGKPLKSKTFTAIFARHLTTYRAVFLGYACEYLPQDRFLGSIFNRIKHFIDNF